ncbi:MAG: type II secretion system minor pseudopilin GspI [Chromatiales bacterium]|nr:type II secretion system minor pseudopilin GspI [Chromatiales bacterium]
MNARRFCGGFTLVEVMVAVVIVAVGMGAAILSVNQNVYNASYLRDKIIASWVAENRLTELRLAGTTPKVEETTGESEMGDVQWLWRQKVSETGVANLLRVDIEVSSDLEPEGTLVSLSGFIGVPIPSSEIDSRWAGAPSEQ